MKLSKISEALINKPLKKFANSRPMEYVCKKYRKNDSKFITALSVSSIVAKDGYGCFVYVWQNEHNKEIPKDKRKFITGLDIANGALMVLAQIAAYMTISKRAVQLKMFDKILGKYFTQNRFENIEKLVSKNLEIKDKNIIKKEFERYKENIEVAFTHLATLITTTIIAKRVLVPYIATPLADFYKNKFNLNKEG